MTSNHFSPPISRTTSISRTSLRHLLWLLLTWIATVPLGATGLLPANPPKPALVHDIHGMNLDSGAYEYTDPYLPLMSTTRDYRVGISRKVYIDGGLAKVRFFLLKPEALDDPMQAGAEELATAPAGAAHWIEDFDMYDDNVPALQALADDFHDHPPGAPGDPKAFQHMHFAICDSTDGYGTNGPNPYECASGFDCYEFDLMLGLSLYDTAPAPNPSGAQEARLYSTRVRVKVGNPKKENAYIDSIEIVDKNSNGDRTDEVIAGPRFAGTTSHGIGSFHTPMIVGENNELLFVRIGGNSVPEYTDENGLPRTSGKHDMVYSVNTSSTQCDVTGWTELRPISFAPIDTDVASFGFAQNTFKTPSGHTIQPHEGIMGNYLWIDQEARNLFFSTLRRNFLVAEADPSKSLYNYTCWTTSCTPEERTATHKGWTMAGLWTNGKMVLLDSLVNNMDFGIRAAEHHHVLADLYSDLSIRLGTGEEATLISGGTEPDGWARTTVQFGSVEHFLNMVDEMKPRTPRDVVWHVTAGAYTEEFAFDDLISHRMLIFSPMNALKEADPGVDGTYYDGNQVGPSPRPMRLQNAATSHLYTLPAYGEVIAGSGKERVENVALGGIQGRGFYLYPESTIRYDIPSQSLGERDWMVSLFLDRRDTTTTAARLVTFPNTGSPGASISLVDDSHVRLCAASNGTCTDVLLPIPVPTAAWTHLAFVLVDASDEVQIYQDGFLFATIDTPSGMAIDDGFLEIGSSNSEDGFEGWIDEVKVAEGPFNVEEICNHARGTLVAMPHNYATNHPGGHFTLLEAPFRDWENEDPPHSVSGREAVHEALHDSSTATHVWPLADYYACNVDYSTRLGISVSHPGDDEIRPLRRRLLFGEGPLIHDQPRPTSTANEFCLSCHDSSRVAGLHTDALVAHPSQATAANDSRRMPSQPPRDMIGAVPEDYFGIDRPPVDTVYTGSSPLITDTWTLDGPLFRLKLDEGAGTTVYNWVGGDTFTGHVGNATTATNPAIKPGAGRGHSLEFDGSGNYVRLDQNVSGDEPDVSGDQLTLAAWVLLDPPTLTSTAQAQCLPSPSVTPCTLIAKSGSSTHDITWGLRMVYNSGWTIQMHVTNSAGTIANRTLAMPGTFSSSQWTHVAAVYDQGDVEIFVDGTSLGSPYSIHATTTDLSTDSTEPVTIGAKLSGGSTPIFPFHGRIDEVHVYDHALEDWEIANLVIETP